MGDMKLDTGGPGTNPLPGGRGFGEPSPVSVDDVVAAESESRPRGGTRRESRGGTRGGFRDTSQVLYDMPSPLKTGENIPLSGESVLSTAPSSEPNARGFTAEVENLDGEVVATLDLGPMTQDEAAEAVINDILATQFETGWDTQYYYHRTPKLVSKVDNGDGSYSITIDQETAHYNFFGAIWKVETETKAYEISLTPNRDLGPTDSRRINVTAPGSEFTITLDFPVGDFTKHELKILVKLATEVSAMIKNDLPGSVIVDGKSVDDVYWSFKKTDSRVQTLTKTEKKQLHSGNPRHVVMTLPSISDPRVQKFAGSAGNHHAADTFEALARRSMLQALGLGSTHENSAFFKLVGSKTVGSEEQRNYQGHKGREAYAKLHGMKNYDVASSNFFMPLSLHDGYHTMPDTLDLLADAFSLVLYHGGSFSPLDKAMLFDLGYTGVEYASNRIIARKNETAYWTPDNVLTSNNGDFTARVDEFGNIEITDHRTQSSWYSSASGGSGRTIHHGEPAEVVLSSGSGELKGLGPEQPGMVWGKYPRAERWKVTPSTTGYGKRLDDGRLTPDTHMLLLTNEGHIRIVSLNIGDETEPFSQPVQVVYQDDGPPPSHD